MSSETSLRLCSRPPRIRTKPPAGWASVLSFLSTCASIGPPPRKRLLTNGCDIGNPWPSVRVPPAGSQPIGRARWRLCDRAQPLEGPKIVSALGVKIFAYDVPRGCTGAYYPECNVLIPLSHHAEESKVPAGSRCLSASSNKDLDGNGRCRPSSRAKSRHPL